MEEVIGFLKRNGFKRMEKNSYANDMCNVVIKTDGYEVANEFGDAMYSRGYNIYWLIGVLTYYSYIDKNYKL